MPIEAQEATNRKKIITLSKPEDKMDEILLFVKKQIEKGNQIFWVCPLIEESAFLDYSSVKIKFDLIHKKFPNNVGLIHGALNKDEKANFDLSINAVKELFQSAIKIDNDLGK